MRNRLLILTMFSTLLSVGVCGQTGGGFTITQATIAGGGGSASNGSSSVATTSGQSAAGPAISGPGVVITSGFWKYSALVPTAAMVNINGRVKRANGQGIPHAILTLSRADGSMRTVKTSPFGYYQFDQVMAGEMVVLSVSLKGFTFSQPIIAVVADDEIVDLDFIGEIN